MRVGPVICGVGRELELEVGLAAAGERRVSSDRRLRGLRPRRGEGGDVERGEAGELGARRICRGRRLGYQEW